MNWKIVMSGMVVAMGLAGCATEPDYEEILCGCLDFDLVAEPGGTETTVEDARDQSVTVDQSQEITSIEQNIDVDALDQSTTYDTEIHQ